MCGIVGFIGEGCATPVILDGLRRLEYRGYDSAGLAVADGRNVALRRALGKLVNLTALVEAEPAAGSAGIGHTRWATHGRPSVENAHPQRSGGVYVVHNGMIDGYAEIREDLESRGRKLESQTDTELIAHWIDIELARTGELTSAVRAACGRLGGSYAIAVLCASAPDRIVAVRRGGSPLVVGRSSRGSLLASDMAALLPYTRELLPLDDGETAVLTRDALSLFDMHGKALSRAPEPIAWDPVAVEKDGHDHFMHKEIFEQPRAISQTLAGRIDAAGKLELPELDALLHDAPAPDRVTLVGCGTAFYAASVGRRWIEAIAGIPAEVERASELRTRAPLFAGGSFFIAVSQSGETADTLGAVAQARERGARVVSVCNVAGSSIPRSSDAVVYTHAGPEIGVASTKAFTTQLVALYLIALALGRARGRVDAARLADAAHALRELPSVVERALRYEGAVAALAQKYYRSQHFMFLGRGALFPIALEGALKLKEVSYIHAEGYAAGELKHGPIALVDESVPSVLLMPRDELYPKMLSSMEQLHSRDGRVIAIATEGDTAIRERADEVLYVPDPGPDLMPIVATLPLQLLAYHVAVQKGTDVDQPRNLAKSVTVE
jgi:glucosamine--fructose-6-phosphate aminotransferase (isomerizing)